MKIKYIPSGRYSSIHYVILITLLWALADGLISFYLPIQIQSSINNLTLFGFLFASSSFVGALSDTFLGYLSTKIRYTLYLVVGLFIAIILSIIALIPFNIPLILLIMAVWGLYHEFMEIGVFSYVSRHKHPEDHSKSFGIIYLFENTGYVIGPVLGGLLVVQGKFAIYGICIFCIAIASLFIKPLMNLHLNQEKPFLTYEEREYGKIHIKKAIRGLKRVWHLAFVMFLAAFMFNVWESFIWTLVPLSSEISNPVFAGFLTSIFIIPLALLEGYGGKIADKHGRKLTFILGFLMASIFTILYGLQTLFLLKIITAFLSALGFAFAYPAMMGETASKTKHHEKDIGHITSLQRIFVNAGYCIGPILAGILGSRVGLQQAFSILGVGMLIGFLIMIASMVHFTIHGRIHKKLNVEFEF